MRTTRRAFFAAAFSFLIAWPAAAQIFPSIPSNTVLGRLGAGQVGPPQAIPFSALGGLLTMGSGGACPVLSSYGLFANTLDAPTDTTINIFNPGTSTCLPWMILNQTAGAITLEGNSINSGQSTPTFASNFNVDTGENGAEIGGDWIATFEHQGSAASNESLIRHIHHSNFAVTGAIPQPIIAGFADRGTFTSPVGIQANDYLLILDGRGYDGSGWTDTAAQINFNASGTWSSTDHESQIDFKTVSTGSTSPVNRMRIDEAGGIDIPFNVTGGGCGVGCLNANAIQVAGVAAVSISATQTLTSKTIDTASNTFKINGAAAGTQSQIQSVIANGLIYVTVPGINFNSANTDTAIPLELPTGMTRFQVDNVIISNASHTLASATAGAFSTTGGGGVGIAANQALTVTATTDATNNNSERLTLTNNATTSFVLASLANTPNFYFRVGTAEGATATADVTFAIRPMP